MADGMSFDKYIDNPSGGQVFTNRQMYKALYKSKFDGLLVREQGQIKFTVYRSEDANDSYYIHMKIPSEVIENFYYDVVIQLFTTENAKKNNVNLREYAVKFYSNDPAFVYTFAHSFKKNNLFIKDLEPKMMPRALKEKADIKNPKDNVLYVKSLFFAYLTMEKYHLFNRPTLNLNSIKYDKKLLLSRVTQADIKVKDRQHQQELLDAEKKVIVYGNPEELVEIVRDCITNKNMIKLLFTNKNYATGIPIAVDSSHILIHSIGWEGDDDGLSAYSFSEIIGVQYNSIEEQIISILYSNNKLFYDFSTRLKNELL
jgi:hypothetical protein